MVFAVWAVTAACVVPFARRCWSLDGSSPMLLGSNVASTFCLGMRQEPDGAVTYRTRELRAHMDQFMEQSKTQDLRIEALQDKLHDRTELHTELAMEHEDMQAELEAMWRIIDKVDSHNTAQKTTEAVLTLADTFDHFDRDQSGGIDVAELKPALKYLGIDADTKTATDILAKYDGDNDRSIDVKEFAALVRDVQMMHTFDANGDGTLDDAELIPALKELGLDVSAAHAKEIVRNWDTDNNGVIDLVEFASLVRSVQVFSRYDLDHSGDIDVEELRPALRRLGLRFAAPQVTTILRRYDADANGRIDLVEFAVLVRELQLFAGFDHNGDGTLKASELRPALHTLGLHRVSVPQVEAILREWDTDGDGVIDLVEFSCLVRDLRIFAAIDTDGDGSIDPEELRVALSQLGVRIDSEEAHRQFKKYDADRSGRIELNEFSRLVKELPALEGLLDGGQ